MAGSMVSEVWNVAKSVKVYCYTLTDTTIVFLHHIVFLVNRILSLQCRIQKLL